MSGVPWNFGGGPAGGQAASSLIGVTAHRCRRRRGLVGAGPAPACRQGLRSPARSRGGPRLGRGCGGPWGRPAGRRPPPSGCITCNPVPTARASNPSRAVPASPASATLTCSGNSSGGTVGAGWCVSFGMAVPFWSSDLAVARHLPHGRHQAGTATSRPTGTGTTSHLRPDRSDRTVALLVPQGVGDVGSDAGPDDPAVLGQLDVNAGPQAPGVHADELECPAAHVLASPVQVPRDAGGRVRDERVDGRVVELVGERARAVAGRLLLLLQPHLP